MTRKIVIFVISAMAFAAGVAVTTAVLPLILLDAALALVHFLAHWLRHNLTRPPGDYYVKQYERLTAWLKRKEQEAAEKEARHRQ